MAGWHDKGDPPPNKKFPWNDETRAKLIALLSEGVSQIECARRLNAEYGGALTSSAISSQKNLLRQWGQINSAKRVQGPPKSRKVAKPRPVLQSVPLAALEPEYAIESDIGAARPMDDGKARTIETILAGECRYPFGDPRVAYALCGRPQRADSPYCAIHHKVCYQPIRPAVKPDEAKLAAGRDFRAKLKAAHG